MAKLVEILARELKEWVGDWPAIGQAVDGTLHREPFLGRRTGFSLARASDYMRAIVTRSEWQAAVDALDIPKFPSDSPEWNGEGLPPVGVKCEVKNDISGEWDAVDEVLVHATIGGVYTAVCKRNDLVFLARAGDLRPIRTPEQIAAEERENVISDICVIFDRDPNSPTNRNHAARLYDAGYRKQEPK